MTMKSETALSLCYQSRVGAFFLPEKLVLLKKDTHSERKREEGAVHW
jgi:hypothetical protein